MSPTVLRHGGFRLFFFSREERRVHVHVAHSGGEAKFWLEPQVEVAQNSGLTDKQLRLALELVIENEQRIRTAWNEHFDSPGEDPD